LTRRRSGLNVLKPETSCPHVHLFMPSIFYQFVAQHVVQQIHNKSN